MQCPCCKYEQKDFVAGYVDVEKVIRSGKRKGKTRLVKEWRVIEQPVGDEEFERVNVIATVKCSGSYDLVLNVCPKCGATFKDKYD